MTKKYLKTVNRVKEAMEISDKFKNLVMNDVYNNLMDQQYWFSVDAKIEGLEYHDRYSSFCYTISDREKFIDSMHDSDFYSGMDIVEKVYEKQQVLNGMDYDNKNYDLLDEWLDRKAAELMEMHEDNLHAFEYPTDETENETIEFLTEECGLYSSYYIEHNNVKIYHKAYTETL